MTWISPKSAGPKRKKFQKKQVRSFLASDKSRLVNNITDRALTGDKTAVLAKGGNFAMTLKHLSIEEIIALHRSSHRNTS